MTTTIQNVRPLPGHVSEEPRPRRRRVVVGEWIAPVDEHGR